MTDTENKLLPEIDTIIAQLLGERPLSARPVFLSVNDQIVAVKTNSEELSSKLQHYFANLLAEEQPTDIEILAVEQEAPQLNLDLVDWTREQGKSTRKDSYIDFPSARVLRKVRTGMVFVQSQAYRIAAGPCLENDNQIINFVNAQLANALLHKGGLTCHAAGVEFNGNIFAMAGFSGGGKSTLMLKLLENPQINYLTNDRLYAYSNDSNAVIGSGIPKLPRVNPGTIVHNPRLHPLISESRRSELLNIPVSDLWDLEEKYDVIIDELYGSGRIAKAAPLTAFLVLNWQRESDEPVKLQQVDINQRRDLLAAIMKSPGPFYQRSDGSFHLDTIPLDEAAYLEQLKDVAFYEASGGINFEELATLYFENVMND
ncbi:MAG: HprK-related kinase B [Pseudomonadales bacterium]|nr:HprK-related kinase B [Pseudomonadales bacterium]